MADWTDSGGPVATGFPAPSSAAVPGSSARGFTATASAAPGSPAPSFEPDSPSAGPRTAFSRRPAGALSPATWSDSLVDLVGRSSFGLLLGSWLVMVLAFGATYWIASFWLGPELSQGGGAVTPSWQGFLTAVYFSFVTATSVGFGDVVPVGPARIAAIIESAAGLLIFGAVVSKLVSRRQDHLIQEIHRIAFEDRLGRVRTNLHMVLSELQSLGAACGDQDAVPERILPRVESAAMVFSGELHAIHDLLYRPQQVPEEAILEAILANLAAGMREFNDLVSRLPAGEHRSPLLGSTLRAISRLAGEICGECVPRTYTPELKVWMDRIQELAGGLSAA